MIDFKIPLLLLEEKENSFPRNQSKIKVDDINAQVDKKRRQKFAY